MMKMKLARVAFLAATCLGFSANSAFCSTLDANYQGVAGNGGIVTDWRPLDIAQTFTVQNTGTLTSIDLLLRSSNPTAALTVDIRTTVGGVPTSSDSGANILSSTVIGPFTSNSPAWTSIDLPDFAVTAGDILAITLRTNSVNYYEWLADVAWPLISSPNGSYAGGQGYDRFYGGAWSNVSLCSSSCNNPALVDFDFKTFVDATTPLPPTLPLFVSGIGALGLLGWRKKKAAS